MSELIGAGGWAGRLGPSCGRQGQSLDRLKILSHRERRRMARRELNFNELQLFPPNGPIMEWFARIAFCRPTT